MERTHLLTREFFKIIKSDLKLWNLPEISSRDEEEKLNTRGLKELVGKNKITFC